MNFVLFSTLALLFSLSSLSSIVKIDMDGTRGEKEQAIPISDECSFNAGFLLDCSGGFGFHHEPQCYHGSVIRFGKLAPCS
jgi:hypothetical protein